MQHEVNTMHNNKLVWDKINQEMADGGYSSTVASGVSVSHSVFFFFEPAKLPLPFFWPPNHGSCPIGRHFVFNFRLRGYPA